MEFGQLFKIDYWWKLVLLCGIMLSGSALVFDIQFIERRYILGLGIGMIFIGIGYWMSKQVAHKWADGGMYHWDIFVHNWKTRSIIGLGFILSIYFLIRILIILIA